MYEGMDMSGPAWAPFWIAWENAKGQPAVRENLLNAAMRNGEISETYSKKPKKVREMKVQVDRGQSFPTRPVSISEFVLRTGSIGAFVERATEAFGGDVAGMGKVDSKSDRKAAAKLQAEVPNRFEAFAKGYADQAMNDLNVHSAQVTKSEDYGTVAHAGMGTLSLSQYLGHNDPTRINGGF